MINSVDFNSKICIIY